MLNIYYSKTVDGCLKNMLNSLQANRGETKHIIFTPDRMTLQVEEGLFEFLNEQCFFDVDVTTLTRFTNKIVAENNINQRVLTKPECVTIIKKILNENKSEFKTIKKALNFNGFSNTIFETISMFKSCNVTPNQISLNTPNKNLNLKLEDIKLVYQKYEDFLQNDYTDSFNKLNLLTKLIKTQNFKTTHFYFVGFEDFTPLMYNVIKELALNSASVNVACAVSYIDELNNKNIFLNNVYLNLLNLAEVNGIKYNKIYCKTNFNDEFNVVSNNLFSIKIKPSTTTPKHTELFKFNSVSDEANFVIKKIQWLIITKKLSYNDFVIITPSLNDYKQKFEQLFVQNNIPYFFDESEPITNSIVVRFYFDLFELVLSNYNKRELFNFLRLYTNLTAQKLSLFEDVVNKSGFNYKSILTPIPHMQNEELTEIYEILNIFIKLNTSLKSAKCMADYILVLNNFTEEFGLNDFINQIQKEYREQNNVLEHNKLNNVVLKVNKGFSDISNVLGSYETTVKDAFNIIKAYFENINIVMPPIIVDSVLVTDIIKGEVPKKKFAIIVGMEEGKMPIVQKDLGIITDVDINSLSNKIKLTPTVNLINKRNKFKVYETFLKFENIVCTYVCKSVSGEKVMPSEIINNFLVMFPGLKLVNGSYMQQDYQTELTNNSYFLFNNTNPNFAKTNLIQNIKQFETNNSSLLRENTFNIYGALKKVQKNVDEVLNNVNHTNIVENLENKQTQILKNGINVSEIESFYTCPFIHFAKYGLKIKETETSEFTAREFGNILHEYVKIIVPKINAETANLEDESVKVLDQILSKKQYEHLKLNPKNANAIKSLKQEILRINNALTKLNNLSTLKPLWLEKKFNDFTISNGKTKIQINGIIDRVDFDDESFSVIDYKTGGSDFSDFTDIASGKKLQLIVYAYVVKSKTNKQPIGTFYLPLNNVFSKNNGEELYKLKGVISNNITNILKLDKRMNETNYTSGVLNLKTNKDGKVSGKILISNEDFDRIINYVTNMVLNACKQIEDGKIAPEPLKTSKFVACEHCEFLGMCKFNEEHGNNFRVVKNVKVADNLNEDF